MKELLNKISSYNLFNYLLPGILFVILSMYFFKVNLLQKNIFLGLFLYYFIGLVISRIGSLIIEPILKKSKFVKFLPYHDFNQIAKENPKIEILSEANNMYRTMISLFLSLVLFKFYLLIKNQFQWLNQNEDIVILLSLLFLFLFSYRKQTKYIIKQVKNKK